MKHKVFDVLVLALAIAVVLGGYWTFQRVRYHDQMDQALIQILQKQIPATSK